MVGSLARSSWRHVLVVRVSGSPQGGGHVRTTRTFFSPRFDRLKVPPDDPIILRPAMAEGESRRHDFGRVTTKTCFDWIHR